MFSMSSLLVNLASVIKEGEILWKHGFYCGWFAGCVTCFVIVECSHKNYIFVYE